MSNVGEFSVFLDTNILYRIATQGKPGCEVEHWEKLKSYVASGSISLVVPEVVLLEFEKKKRELKDTYSKEYRKLEKPLLEFVNKIELWNELGDITGSLVEHLSSLKSRQSAEAEVRCDEIFAYMKSSAVRSIPLDSDILVRASRRSFAGKMPGDKRNSYADCHIVESLSCYFDKAGETQLLFCSENLSDFGIDLKGKKALHPLIQDGLPTAELFTNLESLISLIEEHKAIEVPDPEEVRQAVELEKEKERTQEEAAASVLELAAMALPTIEDAQSGFGALQSIIEEASRKSAMMDSFARMPGLGKMIEEASRKSAMIDSFARIPELGKMVDKAWRKSAMMDSFARMPELGKMVDEAWRKSAMIDSFARTPEIGKVIDEATRLLSVKDNRLKSMSSSPFNRTITTDDVLKPEQSEPADPGEHQEGEDRS